MNSGRKWQAVGSEELWAKAAEMQRMDPREGEWVPKAAVDIRFELLPRRERVADRETVAQYREIWERLPPITVQRDTFVLIDGLHRFSASPSDFVRIVEVDVADEDLRHEAFRANMSHGRALTTAERVDHMRWLVRRHPDWSDGLVAEECGLSRTTVWQHRQKSQAVTVQPVQSEQVEASRRVVGRDGRTRHVPGSEGRQRAAVSKFDPGREEATTDPWEAHRPSEDAWREPVAPDEPGTGGGFAAEAGSRGRTAPSSSPAVAQLEDEDDGSQLDSFGFARDGVIVRCEVKVFAWDEKGHAALATGVEQARAWLAEWVS